MKIKRFHSLTFKLTVWYIVILGIIIGLAGLFLYQGFKERLIGDLDQILLEIADDTNENWREKRGYPWENAIRDSESEFAAYDPFLQLVELSEKKEKTVERIIHSEKVSGESFQLDTHLYCRADRSDINNFIFLTVKDRELSPYPVRIFLFPVRGPRILQVGIPMEAAEGALNQLLAVMVGAGLILLLLASVGGIFIINKALHPVKSVVKTAEKITADDLSLRIDAGSRNDEIGALVATFNDMVARLEKSIKKIRQFSGDVSHELRTPLTIIRGEIEVLQRKERSEKEYKKTLSSVLEESQRMEKIINDLLFLSRVEAMDRSKLHKENSMDEIVTEIVENLKPLARKKGIELMVERMDPVQVKGNRDMLERMVTNLVENAIRYTSAKGLVKVILEKGKKDTCLVISDNGVGIPEESLPYIFDRFYVVDKSRSKELGGIGLGLSIVKWIAGIHGIDIEAKSRVGEGTDFRLKFPPS